MHDGFHKNIKQSFSLFLEHQISILERSMKDHAVTLKIGEMAAEKKNLFHTFVVYI